MRRSPLSYHHHPASRKIVNKDLYGIVQKELHIPPLHIKLEKDNKWQGNQFDNIDWKFYRSAFMKHRQPYRVSISKLSHQLWNTNILNEKFYGQSNICPICLTEPETWKHVVTCPCIVSTKSRDKAFQTLLTAINSGPSLLVSMISAGISSWTAKPNIETKMPSLTTSIPELRDAFNDQSAIGWDALLRGHISLHWKDVLIAFHAHEKGKCPQVEQKAITWTTKLITHLWVYTSSL